jgi:hypothetical protein
MLIQEYLLPTSLTVDVLFIRRSIERYSHYVSALDFHLPLEAFEVLKASVDECDRLLLLRLFQFNQVKSVSNG